MDTTNTLKDKVSKILKRRTRLSLQESGIEKVAAVLLLLFNKEGSCHVLMTKRTQCLAHHKGEISFPGGCKEKGDSSLLHTALREAQEEIGLDSNSVEILGCLDDTLTLVTNYLITPFVGWFVYPYHLQPNPIEIDEMLEIPLSFFLQKERYWKGTFIYQNQEYESHFYKWKEKYVIWGATARIMHSFCELLSNPLAASPPFTHNRFWR